MADIDVTGIPSEEAFGVAQLGMTILVEGIRSEEWVSSLTVYDPRPITSPAGVQAFIRTAMAGVTETLALAAQEKARALDLVVTDRAVLEASRAEARAVATALAASSPGPQGPQGPQGPPGGGSPTFTIVEQNLAAVPARSGRFTIAGTGMTIDKPVMISKAVGPYTGKGTRTDEAEMDNLTAQGVVQSSTIIEVFWQAQSPVVGNFKFNYVVSA